MGQIVAVDWGTTHLRAFRLDAQGAIVAARASPDGMAGLQPGEFSGALQGVLGNWANDDPRILCCGMAGARQGWVEAPYCPLPAGIDDLRRHVVAAPGARRVGIVPGVCDRAGGALRDVMRGEEVQALGAGRDGLFVCPGTHSKWIEVRDGRIVAFETYMTGELYGLLSTHSILRHAVGSPDAPTAAPSDPFRDAVKSALDGGALLADLFSIRAASLDARLTPADAAATLSGLLIGAEIAAALKAQTVRAVTVVGAPAMGALYADALALAGFATVESLDAAQAAARGLWRIGEALP